MYLLLFQGVNWQRKVRDVTVHPTYDELASISCTSECVVGNLITYTRECVLCPVNLHLKKTSLLSPFRLNYSKLLFQCYSGVS